MMSYEGACFRCLNSFHSFLLIVYALQLQGVEPRWKGLNTAIPVVMVAKRSYRYSACVCVFLRTLLSQDETVHVSSYHVVSAPL